MVYSFVRFTNGTVWYGGGLEKDDECSVVYAKETAGGVKYIVVSLSESVVN